MESKNKDNRQVQSVWRIKLPFFKGKVWEIKLPSLSYIFGGKVLTEKFFANQSGLLIMIFCLIILFISNRYLCSKKLSEMDRLKKELVELDYERVLLITRLTTVSRQAQIEELLRGKKIELTKDNPNIYQIRK